MRSGALFRQCFGGLLQKPVNVFRLPPLLQPFARGRAPIMGFVRDHPVYISETQMSFNQDVKVIVVGKGIKSGFLAWWLTANGCNLLSQTATAAHGTNRFYMKELFDVTVGVPPKSEQGEIVLRLDTNQADSDFNQKLASKPGTLKTGLMQDLLSGRKRVSPLPDPQGYQ